jgi:hypothetical protein
MHRDTYLQMPLNELLKACSIKGFRSGGPGGQHRNKTNTGVSLKLVKFGIEIKSSESRSVTENKTRALHRMQIALATEIRENPLPPEKLKFPGSQGRIHPSNSLFPLFVAQVLDIISSHRGDIKSAATAFKLSPSALQRILRQNKKVFEKFQELRKKTKVSE